MDTPSPQNAKQGVMGDLSATAAEREKSGVSEDAAPAQTILTHLTGRDTEVSLLQDRWEQAQEGMGQVVLIVGEPGLGKSRLVDTIKQHVLHGDGTSHFSAAGSDLRVPFGSEFPVVEWRCSDSSQNTELRPAAAYIERFLGFDPQDSPTARFDRLANALEELQLGRPELVALFANLLFLPSDERYPEPGLTPVRKREETFRALREWMIACSRRRPILFIVEDLHWSDASTLEFLGQFIAEGFHDHCLTVLTFRPEFKTPWPAAGHQTNIALNRLTRRQVAEWMRGEADVNVPELLVQQVYRRTAGVPLLVEEFIRMARESAIEEPGHGQPQTEPAHIRTNFPSTLQDLVLARLARMSSNLEVAELAAIIGGEFHYELLAAVVSVNEQILDAELAKLVRAEIVCPKGLPPRCAYAFKHALLEEALRDSIGEVRKRQFHRRIAEVMEARFPKAAHSLPELLARHFTEAGEIDKALSYWIKAGLRSRDRFANIEAINHFNTGLELLAHLDPSPERDARELELLRPLGTAYIASRGYAAPQVGPIFKRARELCERVGDNEQLFEIMWGDFAFHIVRGDIRLCTQLADEALEFARGLDDPGILMVAMFLCGLTRLYRGDFAEAREFCEEAIARYDDRERTRNWAARIGEDVGVTHRCYLALALWHLGFPDQASSMNEEARLLARKINQPFSIEYALHHTGWLCQHCGLGAQTEAAGEEQVRIAKEQGFLFWQASGTLYQAAGILLQAQTEAGLALFQKGLDAYRSTGAGLALPYYLGLSGETLMRSGQYDQASQCLDEALALAEKNDEHFYEAELHRLKGELFLAQSPVDVPTAEDYFLRAIAIARRQQSRAWELRATMSLARLRQRQSRGDEAFAILSDVYGRFQEGFRTRDLIEAASQKEDLGDQRMRADVAAGVKFVRDCIPAPMRGPVSVDWRYIPAVTLGGDTLGYHWIDDDHLAFYLIDVTGHGLDSALLAVTVTTVVRSGSLPATDMRRPEQVLGRLNQAFPAQQYGNKFFTIWYGVYQPPMRTLYWSGGGHPSAIVLSPGSSEALVLPSTGPPIGVIPTVEFPMRSCSIVPDARLVIFSDGAYEILRERQLTWSLAQCIEYLGERSSRGGNLMDDLLSHVRDLHGSHQLDDDFSIIEASFS